MSVAQKEELLGSLTDQPSVKHERSEFPQIGLSPYVLKEIPKLPIFSGPDNDATCVGDEIKCLMEEYTEFYVRKSLRSPAVDERIYLGERLHSPTFSTNYSRCMGQ